MELRLGLFAAVGAVAFVGCGEAAYGGANGNAGLTVPTPIAEGKSAGSDPQRPATKHAKRLAPAPVPPPAGSPPDPPPLRLASQWEYSLIYQAGKMSVGQVRAVSLPEPQTTARRMGRFAIELWIGRELIDRVRFDFPLLADPTTTSGPNLQVGVKSRVKVLIPASPRARRAVLVDRSNGSSTDLAWPPDGLP